MTAAITRVVWLVFGWIYYLGSHVSTYGESGSLPDAGDTMAALCDISAMMILLMTPADKSQDAEPSKTKDWGADWWWWWCRASESISLFLCAKESSLIGRDLHQLDRQERQVRQNSTKVV